MDHAVHYRTAAGETRLEEVGTLDAAVSMVERLRNDEGVSDVRVYRQVPIEFKTYYKVSVVEDQQSAGQSGSGQSGPSQSTPPSAPQQQPQAEATATPPSAPQAPPPGAMPLGPSTPSQPTAQPSAAAPNGDDDGDQSKRGSLFSRG